MAERSPPENIVQHAVIAARMSPCAKSKRGAVIFNPADYPRDMIITYGCNHPPGTLACDGSDACKASCAKHCLHAEDEAIRKLPTRYAQAKSFKGIHSLVWDGGAQLELVHVKVVNNELAAGGRPSCWQCSRLCYEYGIGVWLYESNVQWETRTCGRCGYIHRFGASDAGRFGDVGECPKPHCGAEMEPWTKVVHSTDGTWRYYSPRAFHETTAITCGIYGTGVVIQ